MVWKRKEQDKTEKAFAIMIQKGIAFDQEMQVKSLLSLYIISPYFLFLLFFLFPSEF